ncbi:MAG: HPr-rel-A system PqqD family peptide chaperone [Magnetococcales bacterium]|nr:HPr-rel-A system PqqD family peptide chaperone [Magnetococcales bacterium]
MRWRAYLGGEPLFAQWGDDVALFHPPSGRTHFLNDSGFQILQLLAATPLDLDGLQETLAVTDPEGRAALQRILWQFDQLGLIVPTGP